MTLTLADNACSVVLHLFRERGTHEPGAEGEAENREARRNAAKKA
jgi:hypothetical protein